MARIATQYSVLENEARIQRKGRWNHVILLAGDDMFLSLKFTEILDRGKISGSHGDGKVRLDLGMLYLNTVLEGTLKFKI